MQGIPVLILSKESRRTTGREAMTSNIMAIMAVAELLRTSLGPRGMDKMLVDSVGDVVITNDGAEIAKKIEVEHPAAKIVIQAAKTQDSETGDGTTTVVVLIGELLKKSKELLEKGIHPAHIVNGYRLASEKAIKVIKEIEISVRSDEDLKNIAMTAMASKVVSADREALAKIAVEAVKSVAEKQNGKVTVNLDNIKVVKKEGAKISETKLVKGVILDKELAHPDMPKEINNPKILLTNAPLEVEKTEFDAHIRIDSPDEIQLFKKQEEKMVLDMVEKIVKSGANVVLSQKGINDIAKSFLAKNGIMAVARVNKKDIERLAKAAGARILTSLEEIPEDALGEAEKVREVKIGDSKFVFIEGCKNSKAISILLRAGTKMVVEEAERALHDTLFVVKDVVEDGTFVVGGGAIEAEIAKRIRDYSESVSGKAQLAVKIFADAIEVIPRALSENAGLSVIDIISELRKAHNEGNIYAGINLKTGKVENLLDAGVIEPTRVKVQALKTASEVARMILRIDDVIASKRKAPPRPPGGPGGYGGPAGMGGFGGGMPPGM